MIYLTYDGYRGIGGICDEATFNRYLIRACSVIDSNTHNRITNEMLKDYTIVDFPTKYGKSTVDIPIDEIVSGVDIKVKALCRDLIELFAQNSETQQQVASESFSNGPVSQSVSYATPSTQDVENRVDTLVYDYLSNIVTPDGIPLLYMGCLG